MEKIGLITIWNVPNYGSVLQAYATQVLIEKQGYKCDIINYHYPNRWHYQQGLRKPSIIGKIGRLFGIKPAHRKYNKLARFRKRNFHFSRKYDSLDALKGEDWSDYSVIAVGSDQVWNYKFTKADSAFMLSFVPNSVKRISIASSFAVDSIPLDLRQKYKDELQKFSALSIREKNAFKIMHDELDIASNVQLLLDPTLLIDKHQWIKLVNKSKYSTKKYILLYMLTYAFDPRSCVFEILKYYQDKLGYDIYVLEGYVKIKNVSGLRVKDMTDSGINDFLDLFNNAELVVTSSFHGTAFAVNFGKPLVSVVPPNKEDDRQTTLLTALGLEHCIVNANSSLNDVNPYYDVNKTLEALEIMRQNAKAWLSSAL